MVEDMRGVQGALEKLACGMDSHAQQRSRLRKLFHASLDVPATPMLLEKIGIKSVNT